MPKAKKPQDDRSQAAAKISLFPALAGVILNQDIGIKQNFPFPRTRGGDPIIMLKKLAEVLFSPHSRG